MDIHGIELSRENLYYKTNYILQKLKRMKISYMQLIVCSMQIKLHLLKIEDTIIALMKHQIGNKYTPDRIDIEKVIFREMFRLGDLYRVNDNYYQALYTLIVSSVVSGTKRCFFYKNNKKSFWAKMQYVRNVLQEEPYYKALSEVNRKLLTRSGKFITLVRHHNSVLLYVYYLYTSIKKI